MGQALRAYYNENDPNAAAWLRELIAAGMIPDGEVDERNMLDVEATDVVGFDQCHWFAGIGGWSLALQIAGFGNLRNVWTGSPPCQPFSYAGKRDGRHDDRHLAPHFARLVGDARPGLLFGEQVASAEVVGKVATAARRSPAGAPVWAWLDDLSDRLESSGYAVGTSVLPAACVGSPQIRHRTFFGAATLGVADSACGGRPQGRDYQPAGAGHGPAGNGAAGRMGDGVGPGLEGHGRDVDDRDEPGRQQPQAPRSASPASAVDGMEGAAGERRPEAGRDTSGDRTPDGTRAPRDRNGDASPDGVDTWVDQPPGPGPDNSAWGRADWLFCRDGSWRPVEPGTHPLADGVSGRVGLLRGYGNAIVPQVAAEFIAAFMEAIDQNERKE